MKNNNKKKRGGKLEINRKLLFFFAFNLPVIKDNTWHGGVKMKWNVILNPF